MNTLVDTDRVVSIGYLRASEPDTSTTSFPWEPSPLRDDLVAELMADPDVTDVWYRVLEDELESRFGYSSIVCILKGDPTKPIGS